jgi:hypothetical protein
MPEVSQAHVSTVFNKHVPWDKNMKWEDFLSLFYIIYFAEVTFFVTSVPNNSDVISQFFVTPVPITLMLLSNFL